MTDIPEALPPEINSALVHGGEGPLSLEAAALAFAQAAAADTANAQTLMGIIATVRSTWEGDAADRYEAALQPVVAWFEQLATTGAASAAQIQSAASAITVAIATAPHPVEVTDNRTTYAGLAASNFFGIHFPEMTGLDLNYLQMWLQSAFARGSSDIETEVATGALAPFEPPPMVVNPGGVGAAVGSTALDAMLTPLGAAQAADLAAGEAGWDATMVAGAAGDAVGATGDRPGAVWAARTAQAAGQGPAPAAAASQPSEQVSSLASQMGSMAGQAGSLPAQAGQLVTAPAQQFASLLQPLLSGSGAGKPGVGGLDGLGAGGAGLGAAGAGPLPLPGFAGGTGALAASLARPGGAGMGLGGGMGAGGRAVAGLRLPVGALASAAAPAGLAAAGPGAALAAGESGPAAAAAAGGPGFFGVPPRPGTGERGSGARERYETVSLASPAAIPAPGPPA
jgi:PPE-repeat protein